MARMTDDPLLTARRRLQPAAAVNVPIPADRLTIVPANQASWNDLIRRVVMRIDFPPAGDRVNARSRA